MNSDEKRSLSLQAYCDGELSRFARWRIERKLRRSPELRRELGEWVELSQWVREIASADRSCRAPDTWSEIGSALSEIDREIATKRGSHGTRASKKDGSARSMAEWNWSPLLATGALAALVLSLVVLNGLNGEDTTPQGSVPSERSEVASGSLRYLKTNGVSYVVARDSDDVTIIWLMEPAGAPEGV